MQIFRFRWLYVMKDKSVRESFGSARVLLKQTWALSTVLVNVMMLGCATNWPANATYYLIQPGDHPLATMTQCGYMSSFLELGRLTFAIPSGLLIDKFSRRSLTILVGCLNCISWIMLAFSTQLPTLLLARFLMGSGTALSTSICSVMIGEFASPEYRGIITTFVQLVNISSFILQSTFSLLCRSYEALNIGTTMMSLLFFPSIFSLIESPYYSIRKKRYDEAQKNMKWLRPDLSIEQLDVQFDTLRKSIEEEKLVRSKISFLKYITSRPVRKSLVCAVLLSGLAQMCGAPVMGLYMTVIIPSMKDSSNANKVYYPLVSCVLCFIGSIMSSFAIERFPRRRLTIFTGILGGVIQWFNAYVYCFKLFENSRLWWYISVCSYLSFMVTNRALYSPLTETIASEIFPLGIKGMANSCVVLIRSSFLILTFYMYNTVTYYFDLYAIFPIFSMFSIVFALVAYLTLPETKGKTLVEVQSALTFNSSKEKKIEDKNINTNGVVDSYRQIIDIMDT